MRLGLPLSIALHAALLVGGIQFAPALTSEPSEMIILPVELLTIAESTNVAPIAATEPTPEPEEEEAALETEPEPEIAEPETAPEPEPAAPLPEPETRAEPVPAEKPKPVPKAEPKPEPKPDYNKTLESILKSVKKDPPAATNSDRKAADLAKVANQAPRRGAGDGRRMTMTIADSIRSQLQTRGCWTDQDDMPDAKRLRATIRVRFQRDGSLLGSPELIDPPRIPANDRPMQIFTQRALRALNLCSPFEVHEDYFAVSPPQWIDLVFVP